MRMQEDLEVLLMYLILLEKNSMVNEEDTRNNNSLPHIAIVRSI